YLLRAELESQRRFRITSNRLMSAMIIVAGGLTSALWLTLPARPGTSPSRRSEPAAVAPAAELAATPVEAATERGTDPLVVPVEPSPTARVLTAAPSRASAGVRPRARTKISRRAEKSRVTSRSSQSARPVSPSERAKPAPPRRVHPRPLSPGEFGRQARL
ncbi:MAG: hypothetical protein AB7N65_06770, partial [Vicinamibacterales bacterium]